jgi:hypothetical protein
VTAVYLPGTSKVYLRVPIDGPDGVDVTQFDAQLALMPDNGTEPGPSDWHPAIWIDGKAAFLVGPGGVVYPAGQYMAWATLSAGEESPVVPSGRVRIGDVRP